MNAVKEERHHGLPWWSSDSVHPLQRAQVQSLVREDPACCRLWQKEKRKEEKKENKEEKLYEELGRRSCIRNF